MLAYSYDATNMWSHMPDIVVFPTSSEDISRVLEYANEKGIPVTPRGGGTNVSGGSIPIKGGIVLCTTKMNRIIEISKNNLNATVEPGVILQDFSTALAKEGLFFPPDPQSFAGCTMGGVVAENSGGPSCLKYGVTKQYVLGLEVVLASGEVVKLGGLTPKNRTGYELMMLFTGSEGTLGVVVEATVRLVGLPEEFSAAIVTFPSVESASKAVYDIIRSGLGPASLELLSSECIELINREYHLGLKVSPTLFMEYHGPSFNRLEEIMGMTREICKDEGCDEFRPGIGRTDRDRLLKARHELAEIIMRNHPGCSHMVIDVAIPITYPEMIAMAMEERRKTGIPVYIFGHAGDGNLHIAFEGKTGDEREWDVIEKINKNLVLKALTLGGTATGEHGVGMGKRKFMEAEHGKSLEWMKKIKTLFDPNGILNPGKIFP